MKAKDQSFNTQEQKDTICDLVALGFARVNLFLPPFFQKSTKQRGRHCKAGLSTMERSEEHYEGGEDSKRQDPPRKLEIAFGSSDSRQDDSRSKQLEAGQNVDLHDNIDNELAHGLAKVVLTNVAFRPQGVEEDMGLETSHMNAKDPMANSELTPSVKPEPCHKIFVGGITWDTSDEMIAKLFSRFGTVIEAVVMRDPTNGASRGFGFVTFQDPEAVTAALREPLMLDDRRIDCKLALPKNGSNGSQHVRKVFVGGLSPQTTADMLRTHFSQYGNIVNAVVMLDHATGRSRGFGFVTFDSEEAVEALLQRPQYVGGKVVECRKAVSKQRQMRLAREQKRSGVGRTKNGIGGAFGNKSVGVSNTAPSRQLGIPRMGSYPPPNLFGLDNSLAVPISQSPVMQFPAADVQYMQDVYPIYPILSPRMPEYHQSRSPGFGMPSLQSPADMVGLNAFRFPVSRTSSRRGISRQGSHGPQQAVALSPSYHVRNLAFENGRLCQSVFMLRSRTRARHSKNLSRLVPKQTPNKNKSLQNQHKSVSPLGGVRQGELGFITRNLLQMLEILSQVIPSHGDQPCSVSRDLWITSHQ
eukprot:g81151.t1